MDQEHEMTTVALRFKPPVLRSESAEEYTSLHRALVEHMRPRGPIEAVYIEEVTYLIWASQRCRRCMVSLIQAMSRRAIKSILGRLLSFSEDLRCASLAKKWFDEDEDEAAAAKKEVREILMRFDLDEGAIEAEAIKLAGTELELLEKSLASATSRLDKALHFIRSYRVDFAEELSRQSHKLLDLPTQRQEA